MTAMTVQARRGTAWAIFFNLEGSMTGIKLLVREAVISPLAWGNMALYIALRVRNSLADSYEATVSSSYLGGISSFMAFFVIFYGAPSCVLVPTREWRGCTSPFPCPTCL